MKLIDKPNATLPVISQPSKNVSRDANNRQVNDFTICLLCSTIINNFVEG